MITWDSMNRQILTPICRHCPEEYFAPYLSDSPHVGCCSYSPTFGLFELYKMVKAGQRDYFLGTIFENKNAAIMDDGVLVHADIHPQYPNIIQSQRLSPQEAEDLRLRFSVCPFFVQGKGCGLPSSFKNSTCRSFICMAVEESLSNREKQRLSEWAKEIRAEADGFVNRHKSFIKAKGWTFRKDIHHILDYLASIDEKDEKEREGD